MSLLTRSRVVGTIGVIGTLFALAATSSPSLAQGVTTSSIAGVVKDPQGGVIPGAGILAVHEPSGSKYETQTQGDGRFAIPGMRVGGPYIVTVTMSGFKPEVKNGVSLNLGLTQDLEFKLTIALSETVRVIDTASQIFSSSHTGAATSVNRLELGSLPTISGRINDLARLSPQYGGSGTFSGQDNRATTSRSTAHTSTIRSDLAVSPATARASRRCRSRPSNNCR
jgi:hypothetical protein